MIATNTDVIVKTFNGFMKSKLDTFSNVPKIALISSTDEKSVKNINSIIEALQEIGLEFTNRTFAENEKEEVVNYILKLNEDKTIHGIYVDDNSFGKERSAIVDYITGVKDIGSDSTFIQSVFFTQNVNLSPKLWAIKTFLDMNGYSVLSPFNCAIVGMKDDCRQIMNFFSYKGASTMLLRPHTIDLQEFAQKAHIVVINDICLIPPNGYKNDAIIINTFDNPNIMEPNSGAIYLDYNGYHSLFKLGVAWNLLIAYTTITNEGIEENDKRTDN